MNNYFYTIISFLILMQFNLKAEGDQYPYWNEYEKTPIVDVRSPKWIAIDGLVSGWDWSLPSNTQPSPKGLITVDRIYYHNEKGLEQINKLSRLQFPCNPIVCHWIRWRDIELQEGEYDFSKLKRNIELLDRKGYSSFVRIHSSATDFAPEWLKKYNIPIRVEKHKGEGKVNYEVRNPDFHQRYLKLIAAFGKSGIPQMNAVKGLYLGYASPSNGDEGIGPDGQDPDTVKHVRERIDAWACITKGIESKVYMAGMSNYGFSKGFGTRRGFIEMYLYHIPDHEIGQELDDNGYLYVDEANELIKSNALHGEENEEYEEAWVTPERSFRFGKSLSSFPYRYFTANLRLLQMRCNEVLFNNFTLNPKMFSWVALELGRTAEDAPDAWCFLRESYLKTKQRTLKNFERWVYQRDCVGYETEAVVRINHAIKMWMVEPGKYFDLIARTGNKIGFKVDPKFINGKEKNVALKITYFDEGKGSWKVVFNGVNGIIDREVQCTDSKKLMTATFFVTSDFVQNKNAFNFECISQNGLKPVVSFVRLIKL